VNRWDALLAVCGHLRAGLLAGEPPSRHPLYSWELLVEVSSHHFVTPALAWCLKQQPDVPAEARSYFDAMLALNAKRNRALLAALARIVAACNGIGIEPVPLKGAARLVADDYPARSLRFLGDLDVLIPAQRSSDAFAALQALGFRTRDDDEPIPPAHNHLPMLYDGEGGVELHTEVLKSRAAAVIPTAWFVSAARPCAFEGLRIRLPDAARSIGHIIAHDQLHHHGYWTRRVELRQALDVAMIRARHEDDIDWAELDRRFGAIGYGEILATYLAMLEALFGQAAPRLSHAPRPGAMKQFRRTMLHSRLSGLRAILNEYAAARRRDPRGALQLLDLRRWPARISLLLDGFRHDPSGW
jgi:hypothetical protein